MNFDELQFTHFGCCGSHPWAEVVHDNGLKTQVTNNGNDTYDVSTWMGNCLYTSPVNIALTQDVEKRLNSDAAIRI